MKSVLTPDHLIISIAAGRLASHTLRTLLSREKSDRYSLLQR